MVRIFKCYLKKNTECYIKSCNEQIVIEVFCSKLLGEYYMEIYITTFHTKHVENAWIEMSTHNMQRMPATQRDSDMPTKHVHFLIDCH
jgi:hypothetical protein